MQDEWSNLLPAKISYLSCVLLGIELPDSSKNRFPYMYALYTFLLHLIFVIRMMLGLGLYLYASKTSKTFSNFLNLLVLGISDLVELVAGGEILFIARKDIMEYRRKMKDFTEKIQSHYRQRVDFEAASLYWRYFLVQAIMVGLVINFPVIAMSKFFPNRLTGAGFVALKYVITVQMPLHAYLKTWRINCLAKYLNCQLAKHFSYSPTKTYEFSLEDFKEQVKNLTDSIPLFCQTMGFSICTLIITSNMAFIQGMKNVLNPTKSLIISPEHTLPVLANFLFCLNVIIMFASAADETVANLKKSAKISYKLYLTYPVVSFCDSKSVEMRETLLWMSRGSITENVSFNMRGVFNINWKLIIKIFNFSLTYFLFLMQYD